MSALIIDCGSYSVKFLEGRFQRKNFKVDTVDEVLIDDIRDESDLDTTLEEYQQKIIRQYLEQNSFTGKVISQLPSNFITTRYLELPVNNKKKAELMIPFQLDEDLPFQTTEAHYINTFHKNTAGNFSSIVQITEEKVFKAYHNYLTLNHTLPSVLSSDLSIFQSYVEDKKFGGHICILDIGHEKAKAYFAFNDKILSNHTSSIAGKTIDEVISKTYDISSDDARIYKHENSYFLTEAQLEHVSENQKEFAVIMRQTLSPLVQQVHRWLLGYRIKTGFSVEKIFVTGGSSNIKNIDNFLTEKLEVPVEILKLSSLDAQVDPDQSNSMILSYLMAQSQKFKSPPQSFLTKSFASGLSNGIRMEDSIFTFYRVALICLIIGASILVESFVFIDKEISKTNRSVTKMLKANEIDLTAKQVRMFKKRPKKVSSILNTKQKVLKADIKILKTRKDSDAVKNLAFLSKQIKRNERVSLVQFKADGMNSKAVFMAESKRDIDQLKELIKSLNFSDMDMKSLGENNKLELSFSGY